MTLHVATAALPHNSEQPSPECCYCVGLSVLGLGRRFAICLWPHAAFHRLFPIRLELPSSIASLVLPLAIHLLFDRNSRHPSLESCQLFAVSPSICLIDRALRHLSPALTELMPFVSTKKNLEKPPFWG